MLQEIGGIIRGQLRDYDFLSRYAGDEFIALIPDTNSHDVVDLCRRIETAINEFVLPVTAETFAQVGVSLGASSYPAQGGSFDEMVVAADRGMYAIKSHRKMEQRRLLTAAQVQHVTAGPGPEHADNALVPMLMPDSYVVELDETHIVSSAVN
jgi:diguanylate cyclase (GGDEF)-like protein